jgi:hypothetical protein
MPIWSVNINVYGLPSVESRNSRCLVLLVHWLLVKRLVVRVFELRLSLSARSTQATSRDLRSLAPRSLLALSHYRSAGPAADEGSSLNRGEG